MMADLLSILDSGLFDSVCYSTAIIIINFFDFRYFDLNTEMRHRALQTGRICVRQNAHDGHLTVDELREMVRSDESF